MKYINNCAFIIIFHYTRFFFSLRRGRNTVLEDRLQIQHTNKSYIQKPIKLKKHFKKKIFPGRTSRLNIL